MSNSERARPVFVVGTWHSGTYLLVSLLERHSRVVALPGESHYMVRRFRNAKRLAALPEADRWAALLLSVTQNRKGLIDLEAEERVAKRLAESVRFRVEDLDSMLSTLMEALCETMGKTFWVEKSPTHIAYLDELKRGFADALFVHIVRDPKAVMASTKMRSTTLSARHKKKDIFHPVHEAFSWREAVRRGERFSRLHPGHYHEIAFERLIQRSEETVRALCDFLGLTFDERMLEVEQVNPAVAEEYRREGFDERPLERWRSVLGPADLYILSRICSREMGARGYDAPGAALTAPAAAREALRLTGFLARKLGRAVSGLRETSLRVMLQRLGRKYGGP